MSDLKQLKQRIYDDENIVVLLIELGCEREYISTEQNNSLITSKLPPGFNSTNTRAIQVKNTETLPVNIRTRNISGDIYSLVGFILFDCKDFEDVKSHLRQIVSWICNALEYDDLLRNPHNGYTEQENKKVDYNSWLTDIKKKRKTVKDTPSHQNVVLPESILNDYIPYGHFQLYDDGINFATQKEFEVKFDMHTQRIVFPIRNVNGELIGVKGRYSGNDQTTLDERKYLYLYPVDKSIELFNLHRALPYIKERKEVIVVEGAKTCFMLHQYGYPNCVSLEGNSMTPVQARLLKDLGVSLIFAWDQDINMDFIKLQLKQIKSRVMIVLFDNMGLLGDHNSPTDKGVRTWERLYNECRHSVTGV